MAKYWPDIVQDINNGLTRVDGVGDGVADDTSALTSAIARAVASGTSVFTGWDQKVFLVDSVSIPHGLDWIGNGTIKGTTSGSKPSRADMTGAADAGARSALLAGYYETEIAFTGSGRIRGTIAFENVLFLAANDRVNVEGEVRLKNCSADDTVFMAEEGGRILFDSTAPPIITNSDDIALQTTVGGTISAQNAIITNCLRGARTTIGGDIDLDGAEIWNVSDAGIYILFGGRIGFAGGIIDGCTVAGLINNYGGHFDADGATIRNCTSGVAVIIESNGSCYFEDGIIEDCQNALGVALGGFIQARGVTITGTGFIVANALNDGFISMESPTIDGISNPGVTGVRFQATGSGRILMPSPGTGGLTNLTTAACSPGWNAFGRGGAYIGSMDGTLASAQFASLSLTTDLAIADGGTGASNQVNALRNLGLVRVVTIADDGVYDINLGATLTTGTLELTHNATANAARPCGKVRFRAAASPHVYVLWQENTLAVTTGVLTGTTGSDGTVTVSPSADGHLYIENRSGQSLTWTLVLHQGQTSYAFP